VIVERRLELGERARIGVRVLVVVSADQDLPRLRGGLFPCCELLRRRRRRRDILNLLRVLGLGLVMPTPDREETAGDDGAASEHIASEGDQTRETLDHAPLIHSNWRAGGSSRKCREIRRLSVPKCLSRSTFRQVGGVP
jgi:hypothetical protein